GERAHDGVAPVAVVVVQQSLAAISREGEKAWSNVRHVVELNVQSQIVEALLAGFDRIDHSLRNLARGKQRERADVSADVYQYVVLGWGEADIGKINIAF